MQARAVTLASWIAGLAFLVVATVWAGTAAAQCCAPPSPPPPGCNCQPPPCCSPPTPPPPPTTNCCTPSHNVIVPGVNVFVAPSVNVVVKAQAQASAGASAGGTVFVGGGGGGGGGFVGPGAGGLIQGLDVEGGMRTRRVAYEAQRSRYLKVVIQAFCLDDRDVPHPASQVTPDRDIDAAYEGELFRCIAGTRMQYTWSEFRGQIDFTGGKTIVCAKGEALYHTPGAPGGGGGQGGQNGGQLSCHAQKPARDCNERSLLRRYGAGVKVLTILIVETYTAYREETIRETSATTTTMSLDGGVGGIIY